MKSIIFIVLSLFLVNCAQNESTENGNPNVSVTIEGTFETCAPSQLTNDYSHVILTFNGTAFSSEVDYYDGVGCSGNFLGHESSTGTYSLVGGNKINYAYSNGSMVYDIYELDGLSNLKVGDRSGSRNGLSELNRPTAYSITTNYTRQ